MLEKSKEDSSRQIKMSEQIITSINDLSFNLCVMSQSLVIRLVTYFGIEESHQNRGPKEVK